jgi:L-rhamnono-1,4-lactonase
MPTPIVDSHIHLFPASHFPTLAWYSPDSPLGSQHSVDEYRHASSSISTESDTTETKYLRGFIFLETDRISSVADGQPDSPGWTHALDEVSFLTRIALGEPVSGEGHDATHKDLCLGIIPWAPVPGGPEALSSYMTKVQERTQTEENWRKVRGVRYLVQDKPAGVMLQPQFVEGLRWLGQQGLVFDLGVDARQGGLHQLREAVEMMDRLGDASVTIIISQSAFQKLFTSCHSNLTAFRPSLQAQSTTLTRLRLISSRVPGVERIDYENGSVELKDLHEALGRIFRASSIGLRIRT